MKCIYFFRNYNIFYQFKIIIPIILFKRNRFHFEEITKKNHNLFKVSSQDASNLNDDFYMTLYISAIDDT